MVTILLASIGTLGDIEPFISLAYALRSLDANPILIVNSDKLEYVQRFGFEAYSIGDTFDITQLLKQDPSYMDPRKFASVRSFRDVFVPCAPKMHATVLDIISKTKPAAVISHSSSVGSAWAATSQNIPSIMAFLQPSATVIGQSKRPGALLSILRRINFFFRPICQEIGIPWTPSIWDDTVHQSQMLLGLWSPTFFKTTKVHPAQLSVCGFPQTYSTDCPDEVTQFIKEGEPPVAFGLGSSAVNVAGNFFEDAIQACEALSLRGIFFGKEIPAILPTSILGVPFAPYNIVFPLCKAIVHHGGINTCANALRSKRPMVTVPFAFDQFQNAALLQSLGVSLTLPRGECKARTLEYCLEKITSDPFVEKANTIGTQINNETDGAQVAADKVLKAFA